MARWRRPTPEDMAVFDRMVAQQAARAYAPRGAAASSAVPDRVVREEGAPLLLVGWDDDAGLMIGWGFVGGPVGQAAGNPTVTPELHMIPE